MEVVARSAKKVRVKGSGGGSKVARGREREWILQRLCPKLAFRSLITDFFIKSKKIFISLKQLHILMLAKNHGSPYFDSTFIAAHSIQEPYIDQTYQNLARFHRLNSKIIQFLKTTFIKQKTFLQVYPKIPKFHFTQFRNLFPVPKLCYKWELGKWNPIARKGGLNCLERKQCF